MQKMVMQMMGGLGFSQGGNVRNYSKGGSVPAKVSNGEYLMSREAVNKYGGSFMHGLNARGEAPGFSSGGKTPQQGSALAANFGGAEGYKSGKRYQSQAMSSFFYSGQSGNPGLQEDADEMRKILSEREQARLKAEAEAKAKKQRRRERLGMVAGIVATSFASSMMDQAFNGLTPEAKGAGYTNDTPDGVQTITNESGDSRSLLPGKPVPAGWTAKPTRENKIKKWGKKAWDSEYNFANYNNWGSGSKPKISNEYNGGLIKGYASGGHISGKTGIDQIPAMLSEGEYVIRASSARQIGKSNLDKINAGKFYNGGEVSQTPSQSESSTSQGNTNNINISVNVENGSTKDSSDDSKNNENNSEDAEKQAKMAQKIKQQVVSVIIEEQRTGGLLSKGK